MSLNERTGYRNQSYSLWHRPPSLGRWIGEKFAETMGMIDQDAVICVDHVDTECMRYVEYSCSSDEPIAFIEAAFDDGNQDRKVAKVTGKTAKDADKPAFVVLYKTYQPWTCRYVPVRGVPEDLKQVLDIESFKVRPVFLPAWLKARWEYDGWTEWCEMQPQIYAEFLVGLRVHYAEGFDLRQWSRLQAAWAPVSHSMRREFLDEKITTEFSDDKTHRFAMSSSLRLYQT